MKIRSNRSRGSEKPMLMPPTLGSVSPLLFTAEQFALLDAWLAEAGWPHEHMDSAMLEGYLVALIVWPIELAPGAWLPAVWGIRGWKVAAKIADAESYDRFIVLVMGMFQQLKQRLTGPAPISMFALDARAPYLSGRYFPAAAWATGFLTALFENSAALGTRTVNVRAAVENIARYAPCRSLQSAAMPAAAASIRGSITTLMSERPYRGPRPQTAPDGQRLLRPGTAAAA